MTDESTKKLEDLVGKQVTLKGTAKDSKPGAIVVIETGEFVYIQGLDRWDSSLSLKEVVITGTLVKKKKIPDPGVTETGLATQGATGEQLVLEDSQLVEE